MKPRRMVVTLELDSCVPTRVLRAVLQRGAPLIVKIQAGLIPLGMIEQLQVNTIRQARAEKLANSRAKVRHS